MPAELTEGSTYLIKATTTNMSTKAGVPVAATLTVNIAAEVNSQIIMEDSKVYGFAAEETHTFEFSMAVPMGTGGKAGAVVAEVLDPNGNKLADGSLDVVIQPVIVVPTFLAGTILDIKWRLEGEETWHSWPMVAPANTVTEIKWTVRNDSDGDATFVAGLNINPPFPTIYTDTVTFIKQGEQGDLITSMIPYYAPTSGEVTFEVGALAGLVISTSVADWQYAQVVDRITVTFTLY